MSRRKVINHESALLPLPATRDLNSPTRRRNRFFRWLRRLFFRETL